MNTPIHITDTGKQIDFQVGIYSVKVLGGWHVKTNNFSLLLKEVAGDLEIKSKETFWRTQSFAYGKRAKKIATIDIPKQGKYEIEFLNTNALQVKKSNLIMLSAFQNYLPASDLQICVE
ncbi:MAG: hypothetical protein R2852_07810 [Bacteroidia bacterium]